ncbi:(2Fe-2S) ferredoxin domain-containing protein [Telmatospirillum sp. J64-1]|uniref:(2Fe-2S) ferredoxin domain-containing protein n=1 Tax=Telmatospirillum sp. J64-1 TaxID=2502183 RepID=UPI00115E7463|nr:(2Fe-2S) ferredoxin domain-containing protein [Telmatospirillum sp. J64-1]
MTTSPLPPEAGSRAIILYGRAAFDTAHSLAALAKALTEAHTGRGESMTVRQAHADLAGPSLPTVLEDLRQEGASDVLVIPCMLPADPTLAAWLPGALSHWCSTSGTEMTVRLAPPLESALDLATALDRIAQGPAETLAEVAPSLGKPGWSEIPRHRRQIFFCVGARCLHRGAEPLYQHLRKVMKGHRSLNAGPQKVMCARSSCLYPCNRGPLMVVHPDGIWYGDLTPERIERVIREHLLNDSPASDEILHSLSPSPHSA